MKDSMYQPIFNYYISGLSEQITETSHLWAVPLLGKGSEGILIHEYFQLAEEFIKSDNYKALKDGLEFTLNGECTADSIDYIDIYLEKHGAFYHPARVEVSIKSDSFVNSYSVKPNSIRPNNISSVNSNVILFVLNTAVSAQGLTFIYNEYNNLKHLSMADELCFLPKVFGFGIAKCRGFKISFFLGTWFDGYKEFHVTNPIYNLSDNPSSISNLNPNPSSKNYAMFRDKDNVLKPSDIALNSSYNIFKSNSSILNLWVGDGNVVRVEPPHYFEIYEKASEILTHFYNLKTFEQITHWHHAAGDFIAKSTSDGFDVKLITVRGYDSIYSTAENNSSEEHDSIEESDSCKKYDPSENEQENSFDEELYKALFLFFLNLTLQMRIDRVDGIGDFCIINEDVIPFIIRGFFRSLKYKAIAICENSHNDKGCCENKTADSISALTSIDKNFKNYLNQFSSENLYQLFVFMTDEYRPSNQETDFVKKHLKTHSEILSYYISNTVFDS